jgi:hypothetical protein
MNARVGWLDDFVKWFFNASPGWEDGRSILKDSPDLKVPANWRAPLRDHRRSADSRSATTQSTDRRSRQS